LINSLPNDQALRQDYLPHFLILDLHVAPFPLKNEFVVVASLKEKI